MAFVCMSKMFPFSKHLFKSQTFDFKLFQVARIQLCVPKLTRSSCSSERSRRPPEPGISRPIKRTFWKRKCRVPSHASRCFHTLQEHEEHIEEHSEPQRNERSKESIVFFELFRKTVDGPDCLSS